MAQVKIVTDSSAHFPDPSVIDELGIEVVQLPIHIGQQTYPERINVVDESFLRHMDQEFKNMSVGAPTVSQMRSLFSRLGHDTDSIVCIHVSGILNDIAEIAGQAADNFLGRQRVVVLDTATTSVGVGLIAEAAARTAATGAPLAEVVRVVRGMIPHMYTLVFSDSLEYLESWGRLGTAQAMLGTMLGLKPLATMEDGDFLPVEKVRTYSRATDKLFEFVVEFSHIEQMFVLQHGFESDVASLLERLETTYPKREFPVIGYPPSLAVHIGPRAMGVIVYEGTR